MTLDVSLPPPQPPMEPDRHGIPPSDRLSVGRMVETNGGSSLEKVPGFDNYSARNSGLFDPVSAPAILSPVGEGFVPENVIGRDDRVAVDDPTKLPWRAIAMLTIRYADGKRAMGTAWFLGPKALGTAGHNIYHPNHGRAVEILMTPGYDGFVARFGTYRISRTYCDPRWLRRDHSYDLDYGVLIMDDDTVGQRLGWFGFVSYSDQRLQQLIVNVSGYVTGRSPNTQYFNGGRLRNTSSEFLLYDFDTSGGMSGAPIFALFEDNKRVVVGIHTYGSDDGNRARRIDNRLYDLLVQFA